MQKRLPILFLFLVSCAFSANASGDPDKELDELKKQAASLNLYRHPFWLKLLKYKAIGDKFKSEILSPEFFLSENGNHNANEELQATLEAFYLPQTKNPNEHALCRFPARFLWLKNSLNINSNNLPQVSCPSYNEWTINNSVKSLSLVFATGYLGNPASFYGHILLKFNSSKKYPGSDLLDQSVNYGALIPDNEPALIYVTKGIFGGYDASFSSTQFFRHNHNYGENELRDMWNYELSLTQDEVNLLVAHSWELLGKHFVYYFFNENCAFRMAELLNLIIDAPLLPKTFWSQPGSLFDYLVEVKHRNQPLVKSINIIPSRQNRFYNSFSRLNHSTKSAVNALVDDELNFKNTEYLSLKTADKIAAVNVLLDYTEFRIANEHDTETYKDSKKALLLERLKLPAEKEQISSTKTGKLPPHYGPLPNLVRTSVLHNSELGNGVMLQLRPTYFDFLALDAGRLPNSKLSMMDLKLVYLNEKEWVRSLDFVHVETLNVSKTGLPGDGGFAWKIKFGLESLDLACDDCLVFAMQGGIGKAHKVTNNVVFHYLLEMKAHTNYRNVGNTVSVAKAGFIAKPMDGWKSLIYIGNQQYLDGAEKHAEFVSFENRFGTSRDWDIRLRYEKKVESEVSIGLSLYW